MTVTDVVTPLAVLSLPLLAAIGFMSFAIPSSPLKITQLVLRYKWCWLSVAAGVPVAGLSVCLDVWLVGEPADIARAIWAFVAVVSLGLNLTVFLLPLYSKELLHYQKDSQARKRPF